MRFRELTDYNEVLNLIRHHNDNSTFVVLDCETTGLNPFTDKITDIVIQDIWENSACIFPGKLVHVLKSLIVPIVAHNFRFDFGMAFRAGIDLRDCGLHADTMLLDHLLDENQEHSLDAIVKRRYNDNYKEVFWSTYKTFEEAPREAQIEYACKDVVYTGYVFRDTLLDLDRIGIPVSLHNHVHALALALYDTEINGIKLDLPYLEKMGETLTQQISTLKAGMRTLVDSHCTILENNEYIEELELRKTEKGKAGVKRPIFNFDSSKQLGTLIYDRLKLPVQLNKQKNRTVDDAALERIESRSPFVAKLREYRGYQKTYTSFIEGSLKKLHQGRIYPSFNVNGTVTGRISSSNPNMQQLPKDGGVRGIYIPDLGYKLISCDYKQLEVTLAAHYSRDTNLLRIVYDGASQHDITAAGLGVDRQTAKTINFALQYGAGARKIQSILTCSEAEAEDALRKYWETYSGLRDFIKTCHDAVEHGRPLINPFGRQRRFPNPKTLGFWEMERAKRQAANSLIQGTGADITSRAFYLVNDALIQLGVGKALFPVHDEIIVMAKDSACQAATDTLTSIMKDVGKQVELTVPLDVDCSAPMDRWSKC